MNQIERLHKLIKEHHQKKGKYPKVRVSRDFWENNADEVAKLHKEGIKIQVDDNILLKNTFLLDDVDKEAKQINTLKDLKRVVDQLIEEGKGEWPVVSMPWDTNTYHRIEIFTIVPGEAPYEGLELFPNFDDAPEGEHILVQVGD